MKDGNEYDELGEAEARVLSLLDDVGTSPDRICTELGFAMGTTALALSQLEVRGLALRRGGYQITTAGARARAALHPEGNRTQGVEEKLATPGDP